MSLFLSTFEKNYIPVAQGSKNQTYNDTIRNDVLSNAKECDLTASYAYYTTALSTEGLFYNWLDVKNIDLSRVWWGARYGLVTYLKTSIDNFFPCFGVDIVTKDDNGNYQVAVNSEHTVAVTDKLNQLFYSDNRTYLVTKKGESVSAFVGDHAAFTLGGLEWYPSFKDMESDYGVLPDPKFDENQESYYNYTELTPAYYEIVLKGKSARDSESFAMLDIVHDSISFDLGFFYSGALGNPAQMFRKLLKDSTSANFASYWEANGPALEANVKALIEAYNK